MIRIIAGRISLLNRATTGGSVIAASPSIKSGYGTVYGRAYGG